MYVYMSASDILLFGVEKIAWPMRAAYENGGLVFSSYCPTCTFAGTKLSSVEALAADDGPATGPEAVDELTESCLSLCNMCDFLAAFSFFLSSR